MVALEQQENNAAAPRAAGSFLAPVEEFTPLPMTRIASTPADRPRDGDLRRTQ
ncbi:hypothetical protein J2X65_002742 [Ancylobacter sp. 3268]|uniref:hypothetical protein n=1 Tax=Ancylobacter sp. 3268 TaxID=2817752 RepID=UPI002865E85E|nr:hypothetical protein [Ancylobacter sp. 3268]MDR6953381.1 hypothetical protein [Ancylobacter sp. 3268]